MVVYSLTNKLYLSTSNIRYDSVNWKDDWKIFINLYDKQCRKKDWIVDCTVGSVIYWFDTNIVQQIGKSSKTTLDVRIRIVCGMINSIPTGFLSRELKIQFMECIWDAYKKLYATYVDWHCKWILGVPF